MVVQTLLAPEVAGVMFTQNPINQADERLIEASWGLGEVVVSGRVIPDTFRIDRGGDVLERTSGVKKIAIRASADGGTFDETVATPLVEQLCLDDDQLAQLNALAAQTEEVYGPALRHRVGVRRRAALPAPVPGRDARRIFAATARSGGPAEVIERVPLFAN